VRGDRLIILSTKMDGREPVLTEVYPEFSSRDYQSTHCGAMFMQTWDGSDVLTKTILSLTPLVDRDEGTVPDEHFVVLDRVWQRGFSKHGVFPACSP
jgi:hypothetical protein